MAIELVEKKELCCGCRACEHVCPVNAIVCKPDECGFIYPEIDSQLCVECSSCVKVCAFQNGYPARKEFEPYYAFGARHLNPRVHMHSRSGGVFVALSDQVFRENGVVYGAGYDPDSNFRIVCHKRAETPLQRDEFCGSKYAQSDLQNTFIEARKDLEEGKTVLFSGTGCQIGSLHRFLGREYDNLITVDIVCHGVASPAIWADYLNLQERTLGQRITSVDFRDKAHHGWRAHFETIETPEQKLSTRVFSKLYYKCFNRPSCHKCIYANKNRPADITLADFWGHESVLHDLWDDDKGISLVLVNTSRGLRLWESSRSDLDVVDCTGYPFRHGSLKKPYAKSKVYDEFWGDYSKKGFEYCIEKYLDRKDREYSEDVSAVKEDPHFDVGIIVFAGDNYGSAATNVALYAAIEDMGYKPIVLDTLAGPNGVSRLYIKRYLKVSSSYSNPKDYSWANEACDAFIVGSDQSWRWDFPRFKRNIEAFLLAFTADDKRRIAYAVSFGPKRFRIDERLRQCYRHLLRRFDAIGVREDYAVTMNKRLFGVDSQQVVDPVFLAKAEIYRELARKSSLKLKPDYVFAYILEPTVEKERLVQKVAEEKGLSIVLVRDAGKYNGKFEGDFKLLKPAEKPRLEDWMSYFVNAACVVTDSYHGTCFSLILHKDFIAIKARATSRFNSLINLFSSLEPRYQPGIYDSVEAALSEEGGMRNLDYEIVDERLLSFKKESFLWLQNALRGGEGDSRRREPDLPWVDYSFSARECYELTPKVKQCSYEISLLDERKKIIKQGKSFLESQCELYGMEPPKEWELRGIDNAQAYFDKLDVSRFAIVLAGKDDCGKYWKSFVKATGLPLTESLATHQSYIGLVDRGNVVAERASDEFLLEQFSLSFVDRGSRVDADDLDQDERRFGAKKILVVSRRYDEEALTQTSRILIDNIDYSLNQRGINVVVFDWEDDRVIDSFAIDLRKDASLTMHRS